MTHRWDETRALELVRVSVSRVLPSDAPTPSDQEDLVKAGLIDSMGWVAILSAIEEATGIGDFGSAWPEGRSQSIRALVEAFRESVTTRIEPAGERRESQDSKTGGAAISLAGWGFALGGLRVGTEEVERECGVAPGSLRAAGIDSVCRADDTESELVLGARAVEAAFGVANVVPETIAFVVATSATFLAFPSLAASLHSLLLLPESCGAIDVGGACVGLIQALATAKALLADSQSDIAVVVASEVHTRRLRSPKVPAEFGGLLGDGACAFVLRRLGSVNDRAAPTVGRFAWGCSGTFASSLRLSLGDAGEIEVQFKGKQLASAAVSTLDRTLNRLENLSGKSRSEVCYFALHEPNPRVVEILAQRAKVPLEKIPLVSKTSGNLGSATCGVSLCKALSIVQANAASPARPLIFLAAVGPGLVWGGTYLH